MDEGYAGPVVRIEFIVNGGERVVTAIEIVVICTEVPEINRERW